MAEWNNTHLSEVLVDKGYIRGPFGSALKRCDMKDNGIPVYEQQHAIYNSRYFRYYIDEQKFNEMKRFQVNTDDLIISCSGTVGKVSIIRSDDPKGIISQALLILRVDQKKILPLYLKYFFTSRDGYNAIVSRSSGSVQVNIAKRNVIEQIPLMLPKIEIQRKIVEILNSIDNKIEENEEINNNLEQQAQAIYHERFETVSPNDLPSDWRIVTLGEVATISNKSFNPLKEPEILLEHYSIPAFDEVRFPVFELSTSIKSNKFIIDASCFMISKLNPTTKRVWKPYCLTGNAVCSTEFIVYKAKDKTITDFLYSVIDSNSFSDFMCSHVTGSTGSRQRTTPSDTLSYELILPSEDELAEFQSLVSPMYAQIRINAIENDRLKRLRDSLLPKLMSGEIDVSTIQL